ncbi:MAG: cbb3-type cytochrome oxidase assembly protein [Planctomycetales bacterium]|nr:cbb3-type cytochrome oxidase assembly protein [Planctomycetales bacterium]
MIESPRANRIRFWVTLALALAILIPSLWGFGSKFVEFIAIYRGEVDGAFAIAPILNYLLASLGFLMMFLWAVMNGMFHDIERPKYKLLEVEAQLDKSSKSELRLR